MPPRAACRFDAVTNFKTGSTLLLPMFESDIERFRALVRGEEPQQQQQQQQQGQETGRVAAVIEFSNKGGINAAEGFGDVDLVVAKSVARRYGYGHHRMRESMVYLMPKPDAAIAGSGACTTKTCCAACRKPSLRKC